MARLDETLARLDARTDYFDEHTVSRELREVDEPSDETQQEELMAERVVFGLAEDYEERPTGWSTYYGPMFVSVGEDGNVYESPSLQRMTPEMVNYWLARASVVRHPTLRLRYADAAWDLMRKVTGEAPTPEAARLAVSAALDLVDLDPIEQPIQLKPKLERALSLALSLRDNSLVEKVCAAIIEFEDRVAQDSQLGLWGFAFDWLVDNRKVQLTEDQKQKIVHDLEARLQRVSDRSSSGGHHPFAVEAAVKRLLRYYKRGSNDEVRQALLERYRDAFLVAAEGTQPMVAAAWLSTAAKVLRNEGAPELAETLEPPIRQYSRRMRESMVPIEVEGRIDRAEIESFLDDVVQGSFEEAITQIAVHFLPRASETRANLAETARATPIQFLMSHQIVDKRGMIVATVPPLHEDESGHLVRRLTQELQLGDMFLSWALERLWQRYPEQDATATADHILRAPIFDEDSEPLVRAGLEAYFNERWVECVCVLAPCIEGAIRALVGLLGGQIYRRKADGYIPRQLGDLLDDPTLSDLFGENVPLYFKTALVDRRGENLRNLVCHGELQAGGFCGPVANRLVHILLILALTTREEQSGEKDQPG